MSIEEIESELAMLEEVREILTESEETNEDALHEVELRQEQLTELREFLIETNVS